MTVPPRPLPVCPPDRGPDRARPGDQRPFSLVRPHGWAAGVIIASPHSGRDYPDWLLAESRLPLADLRSSEDAFVDRLVAGAPIHGAALLVAHVPRCIVDLNRAADEIDPVVVQGVPRQPLNPRTLAGLGVIPRVVARGRTIHASPIGRAEADRRIARFWRPYHAALAALIDEAKTRFGQAVLIDMHSMPRDALAHLPGPRPDMVLGNRHGLSASARVIDAVADAFAAEGWTLRRNTPFSGAYIAAAYGRPTRHVHVVQVEIDRSLYMDEATLEPLPGFTAFAARIDRALARLARLDGRGAGSAVAAE